MGIGCNPDFYAWSTGDRWRVRTGIHYNWGDLFGPSRPQTKFHGPNQPVRYQTGEDKYSCFLRICTTTDEPHP